MRGRGERSEYVDFADVISCMLPLCIKGERGKEGRNSRLALWCREYLPVRAIGTLQSNYTVQHLSISGR